MLINLWIFLVYRHTFVVWMDENGERVDKRITKEYRGWEDFEKARDRFNERYKGYTRYYFGGKKWTLKGAKSADRMLGLI